MAVEGVVVDGELGVQGEDAALLGDDEGVDLGEAGVALDGGLVEAADERVERGRLLARHPEAGGEGAADVGLVAGGGVDGDADDGVGIVGGDDLDLLAALGRGHDEGRRLGAVDDDGEVELARDGGLLLDEDVLHELALGAGLDGDEVLAEDAGGFLLGLRGGAREAHAADAVATDLALVVGRVGREALVHGGGLGLGDEAALAAPAGVDLGLDDDLAAELFGDGAGFRGGARDAPAGDLDAVLREERLRLVLVNLHRSSGAAAAPVQGRAVSPRASLPAPGHTGNSGAVAPLRRCDPAPRRRSCRRCSRRSCPGRGCRRRRRRPSR